MILSFIFLLLIILLCSIIIIFIYDVLTPAMKQLSLYVGETLFSSDEIVSPVFREPVSTVPTHKKAVVLCCHEKEFNNPRAVYTGISDCHIFASSIHSHTDCPFSCCGLGTCAEKCPQRAIIIINYTAVITDNCTGCGLCVDACPRSLIRLVESEENVAVRCAAPEGIHTTCSQYLKHNTDIPLFHAKRTLTDRLENFIRNINHKTDKTEQGDLIE